MDAADAQEAAAAHAVAFADAALGLAGHEVTDPVLRELVWAVARGEISGDEAVPRAMAYIDDRFANERGEVAEGQFNRMWPGLFAPLSAEQRRGVLNALASIWHEGWVPSRQDASDLIDFTLGRIDEQEYDRRGRAKVSIAHSESKSRS